MAPARRAGRSRRQRCDGVDDGGGVMQQCGCMNECGRWEFETQSTI
jgi:hypothetical protein